MSSPAAIYEVCVPDVFHGIVPVRGLKTIFRRIDGSLIMELNNRFMNKRLFPFLFLLSLFAFASLPAYQSCRVEAVTVSTDTNRKEVSKRANQRGPITEAKGWLETLYAEWKPVDGAEAYHVYVKGGQYPEYNRVDAQLVREYKDYFRVDVPGLKSGTYSLKIAVVKGGTERESNEVTDLKVTNYTREGFAHKNYFGVGAYNDDGTLKDGATVVYVSKDNAKTVSAHLSSGTFTGLQAILNAYEKGNVTNPLDIRILGILHKEDVDALGSSVEGIQLKGKQADSEMNITIEGIGEDACVYGFGFLVRNAKSVEFRNLGIMRAMDDGVSLDTDNSNIWIHHMDLFYGKPGSGDHIKGDGSIDIKTNSKWVTVDHCHFWDTGKTSMCGMKKESGPNYITYHHNWFDHSDSRHARVRTMSVHLWNNYYDGCAKYGIGATMGSSVFSEGNYFRATKHPILISKQGSDAKGMGKFSGELGGMVKEFGSIFAEKGLGSENTPISYVDNHESFDFYQATTRRQQVPSSVKALNGGSTYNNFDTDTLLMYRYSPDEAAAVPARVTGFYGAGRLNHGTLRFKFNNAVEDSNSAPIPALEALIDAYAK
jgi:pectate lyase/amb allergen